MGALAKLIVNFVANMEPIAEGENCHKSKVPGGIFGRLPRGERRVSIMESADVTGRMARISVNSPNAGKKIRKSSKEPPKKSMKTPHKSKMPRRKTVSFVPADLINRRHSIMLGIDDQKD